MFVDKDACLVAAFEQLTEQLRAAIVRGLRDRARLAGAGRRRAAGALGRLAPGGRRWPRRWRGRSRRSARRRRRATRRSSRAWRRSWPRAASSRGWAPSCRARSSCWRSGRRRRSSSSRSRPVGRPSSPRSGRRSSSRCWCPSSARRGGGGDGEDAGGSALRQRDPPRLGAPEVGRQRELDQVQKRG